MIGVILALIGGASIGLAMSALCSASAFDDYRELAAQWRMAANAIDGKASIANTIMVLASDLERLTSGDRSVLEGGKK